MTHPSAWRLIVVPLLLTGACANRAPEPSGTPPVTPAVDCLVDVPFTAPALERARWELELMAALAEAGAALDDAYWAQIDPRARGWLAAARSDRELSRRFEFGGPWDRFGTEAPLRAEYGPAPPGRNFYPAGIDRAALERYLLDHPAAREPLMSSLSVVRRNAGELVAIPFHIEFAEPLARAAEALRRAARVCRHPPLAAWLRGRAQALLSDDYFASDVDWVGLEGNPIEVVIGPFEEDEDRIWGVKAAYQLVAGWVDHETTARLATYSALHRELESGLPWSGAAEAARGGSITARLVAVHDIMRFGDARHSGYTAVATNLPNDPRVQSAHGTRKLFFMPAMRARVGAVIAPIAARLIDPAQQPLITSEAYLHGTALHELAHAMGPKFVGEGASRSTVGQRLADRMGPIEECKATLAGLASIPLLRARGLITAEFEAQIYVTELAGILRDIRLGESHAQASLIALQWYRASGAVRIEPDGSYHAVLERWPAAVRALAAQLLEVQARGDYDGAGRLLQRGTQLDPIVRASLARLADLPTEVFPRFPEQP